MDVIVPEVVVMTKAFMLHHWQQQQFQQWGRRLRIARRLIVTLQNCREKRIHSFPSFASAAVGTASRIGVVGSGDSGGFRCLLHWFCELVVAALAVSGCI